MNGGGVVVALGVKVEGAGDCVGVNVGAGSGAVFDGGGGVLLGGISVGVGAVVATNVKVVDGSAVTVGDIAVLVGGGTVSVSGTRVLVREGNFVICGVRGTQEQSARIINEVIQLFFISIIL